MHIPRLYLELARGFTLGLIAIAAFLLFSRIVFAQEVPPTATPVPTFTLQFVQHADLCTERRSQDCEAFVYHGSSATIGDFTLHARRANENPDKSDVFILKVGTVVATQTFASSPFVDTICTNGLGRRTPDYQEEGSATAVRGRPGEEITCDVYNARVVPTATPVPATSTPAPTSTPSAPATPFVVVIQQPAPPVAPVATVAPAVVVRPPNTGDAGLAAQ